VDIVRAAFSGPNGNIDKIKTVVNAALDKGIYVILDYHSHSAHNEESTAQSFFNTFLNDSKYVGKPNILYEIYNEPIGESFAPPGPDNHWRVIKPYMQRMTTMIRGKDANNIILIGTPWYCLSVDAATADPVTGSNLAYVFHFYAADEFHDIGKASVLNSAISRGFAVYVSEFGTSEASGKGTISTAKTQTWFELLDKQSIGWCNWSVSAGEESSALSSGNGDGSGWSTRDPGGTFIRQKLIDYATKTYTITVTKTGQGDVTVDPPSPVPHGSSITLTPKPAAGWKFAGWSGTNANDIGGLGLKNPGTVSGIYANKSFTATFIEGGLLNNGDFGSDLSGWTPSFTISASGTIAYDAGTMKVNVTSGGSALGHASVRYGGIDGLYKTKKYTLSFRAKTESGTKTVTTRFTNNTRNSTYKDTTLTLGSSWQTYTVQFTMCGNDDTNAMLSFEFGNQGNSWAWSLDDVLLQESGTGECQGTAVLPAAVVAQRPLWSVSRANGALQLRGPAEAGAKVSLYDVRGKMVRGAAAADGMTLGNIPAGSYLLVVKSRAGVEVLRKKVVMAK
jgi:hypothetical protein